MQVRDFKDRTRYDLQKLIDRYISFMDTYYQLIINYYSGKLVEGIKDAFSEIKALKKEMNRVESLFEIHSITLSDDLDSWTLLQDFEDMKIKLETVINTPKYLRSTYVYDYDRYIKSDYISGQQEMPEQFSIAMGFTNPDDWIDIIINSDIEESDYDYNGGSIFKINVDQKAGVNIQSVVDVITGENVLGKDLLNEVVFVDDDLSYLDPIDTLNQSASILISLRRGDTPEFQQQGIDIVEGTTRTAFDYPILIRQIGQNFASDDSFESVEVVGIEENQDSISLQIEILSKLNKANLIKEYVL